MIWCRMALPLKARRGWIMGSRRWAAVAGLAVFVRLTVPAFAGEPVAMVEEVTGAAPGVEFMEYLSEGKVIHLAAKDTLLLDYFRSCVRERISGGTVTIGAEKSSVAGGTVESEKVQCDGGQYRLSSRQAMASGVVVYRALPRPTDNEAKAVEVDRTLYGLSPLFDLGGSAGTLVVERVDRRGERIVLKLRHSDLVRGTFYDFAAHGQALAAGGTYRASSNGRSIVFKIDPSAQPGEAALAGRLVRL